MKTEKKKRKAAKDTFEDYPQSSQMNTDGSKRIGVDSGHVEAAVRGLDVRRCKQAGMRWRHQNAVSAAAIHAHYRSRVA